MNKKPVYHEQTCQSYWWLFSRVILLILGCGWWNIIFNLLNPKPFFFRNITQSANGSSERSFGVALASYLQNFRLFSALYTLKIITVNDTRTFSYIIIIILPSLSYAEYSLYGMNIISALCYFTEDILIRDL